LAVLGSDPINDPAIHEADAALTTGKANSSLKIGGLVVASPEQTRLRTLKLERQAALILQSPASTPDIQPACAYQFHRPELLAEGADEGRP
jgi:hypothetical protein